MSASSARRGVVAIGLVAACLGACGDDDSQPATPSSSVVPASTSPGPTTTPAVATTSTVAPVDCGLGSVGTNTVTVAGHERTYDLYSPADLGSAGRRVPAMVLFHGFTGNAADIATATELATLAPELGVVLVVPQALGDPTDWHITDASFGDVEFSDTVVDRLRASPCVDASTVWLAGFSAGSAWSGVYGCAHADQLAGLVLVSGLPPPVCPENASPIVQITHGTADPLVPFEGGDQPVGGWSVHLDPVPESAAGWAARAGCAADPALSTFGDATAVTAWTGCAAGSAVTLHASAGLGHVWPVGAFNPGCVALRTMTGAADVYEPCA